MDKHRIDEFIDEKRSEFIDMSNKIWDYAEMRFIEHQSAELLAAYLEAEGFAVERGIAGMPTAFVASYGNGHPVVALLGEFDALAGLSQASGIAEQQPLAAGESGHGCGHNLLGVGALAAAIAAKRLLVEHGLTGTVRYYGCPGEEGGSGKAFMAREGAFDDVDAALTWHPFANNGIMSVSTLANIQAYFRFHGRSAHAASSPHLGRSALDAVELMNVGVNYLREHIVQEARVHYAVTNTGGTSPNVVQAEAEVLYLIRAPKMDQVQEIYNRVINIARGAALMTDTTCDVVFDKACSNFIPNQALETHLHANFQAVGTPAFDDADLALARAMQGTLSASDIKGDLKMATDFTGKEHRAAVLAALQDKVLSDVILPYAFCSSQLAGSTDVGDVSWVTPTAQVIVACQAFGTPMHTWQAVAQSATSLGHKGMLTAAKVLGRTVIDLLQQPQIIVQAKQELAGHLEGTPYACPIPKEIKPTPFKK